jgi:translation elongation factor EF-Ts
MTMTNGPFFLFALLNLFTQAHGFSSSIPRKERVPLIIQAQNSNNVEADSFHRRTMIASVSLLLAAIPLPSLAADDSSYTRQTKDVAYTFTPPPSFEETKKPLPTHLDEVNFKSTAMRGYEFGIAVDPVRIKTLADFGTPEQVAAKVVMAEVNRDGVTEVTLVGDPVAMNDNVYVLDYISTGKRGIKHFVCKIVVQSGKLHVLTAQVLQDSFENVQKELMASVESFRVL